MFFRIKKSGDHAYVQVVKNKRVNSTMRRSIITNLGAPTISSRPAHLPRCFRPAPSSLTRCCSSARWTRTPTDHCRLQPSASADLVVRPHLGPARHRRGPGGVAEASYVRICSERALFVATLHRLFVSGSDLDFSSWIADYDIAGVERSRPTWFLSRHRIAGQGTGGEASRCARTTLCRGHHRGATVRPATRPVHRSSLRCSWTRRAYRSSARAARRWADIAIRRIIAPT